MFCEPRSPKIANWLLRNRKLEVLQTAEKGDHPSVRCCRQAPLPRHTRPRSFGDKQQRQSDRTLKRLNTCCAKRISKSNFSACQELRSSPEHRTRFRLTAETSIWGVSHDISVRIVLQLHVQRPWDSEFEWVAHACVLIPFTA